MLSHNYSATGLCLIVVLTFGLLPKPARADGGSRNQDKPIRLYATAFAGPIGTVAGGAMGRGAVAINGRTAYGEQAIWGGDLLRARDDMDTRVLLDSIGQLTLSKGAIVRLATTLTDLDDNSRRHVLVASLINGDMTVMLREDASAYVRACGSAFTSSDGARFNISANQGQAVVHTKAGTVHRETQPVQRKYNVRPFGHGNDINMNAGGFRYIRVQVTDGQNRPMPEMPVMFKLGDAGIGILGLGMFTGISFTAITNADGIATVPFTAGRSSGSSTITAVVEETGDTWTGRITVVARSHTARNVLIVIAAAAAVGLAIALTRSDEDEPLVVRPPEVKP